MAEDDPSPRLESARTYFDAAAEDYDTFGDAFIGVLSGILLAIGSGLVAFQEATVNFFVSIIDAFAGGGVAWIQAFTTDPAGFISASFNSAAEQLQTSPWNELGPFLPWIAAIVAIGVVFIITWYLDRRDSDVPGTGVDLPVIGNDEDGDFTDEN